MTNIKRKCYSMASTDGVQAEIIMYGDVVEQQPKNWWGEPVEGNFIILNDFIDDLQQIRKCKSLLLRINSYGGDSAVGLTIHNKLREMSRDGMKIECIIDGVAMSSASIIMCACDNVKINPASIIMVHKCWCELWGAYNADELRKQADMQDTYDEAAVSTYKRKTGLSETKLMHMMAETTYMTGGEAVELGFADELLEDAQTLNIAASANGRAIYCNGKTVNLPTGFFAPDSIPTVNSAELTQKINNPPVDTGRTKEGGSKMTLDELRQQYPDIVNQLETEIRASMETTVNNAVAAERNRLQAIDEVANLFDSALVNDCKYGENPTNAEGLALKAAKAAAAKGAKFINALENDAKASGTAQVGAVPPPESDEVDPIAHAKAQAEAYNRTRGGK